MKHEPKAYVQLSLCFKCGNMATRVITARTVKVQVCDGCFMPTLRELQDAAIKKQGSG